MSLHVAHALDDETMTIANLTTPSRATLVLPASILGRVLAHLRTARPAEGVGLLAAREPFDPHVGGRIVDFFPGTNTAASANRFTMDPREVVAAFREMRHAGWTLGAIVHSHPSGPTTPSPTDIREAHYPDAAMMIVSFADAEPVTQAWSVRLTGCEVVIQEIEIRVVTDS